MEGVKIHRLALEKEYKKNHSLSQEIMGALQDARVAQEGERVAQEELVTLFERLNEVVQEAEELKLKLGGSVRDGILSLREFVRGTSLGTRNFWTSDNAHQKQWRAYGTRGLAGAKGRSQDKHDVKTVSSPLFFCRSSTQRSSIF